MVEEIILGKFRPEPGCIWALGCESIRPVDLEALGQRCNGDPGLMFHCEPLDPRQVAQKQEWLGHASIGTTRVYDGRGFRPEDSPTFKVAYG